VTQAVVAAALVVAAINAVAGLLGVWLWHRGVGEGDERLVGAFWTALRAGQGAALVLAIAVASLALAGKTAEEGLFYLYALLPLAVAFVAEQLRVASAQAVLDHRGLESAAAVGELPEQEQRTLVAEIVGREIGVMSASALVVVFLALRAASTAHGF
jgi:hypothetical protein